MKKFVTGVFALLLVLPIFILPVLLCINAYMVNEKLNVLREAVLILHGEINSNHRMVSPTEMYYSTDTNTEKSKAASLVKIGKELEGIRKALEKRVK